MSRHWTFGQKLGAGFAAVVLLTVAVIAVAVYTLDSVVEAKDRVVTINAPHLLDARESEASLERRVAASRGYLLARDEQYLERMRQAHVEFAELLAQLKRTSYTEEGQRMLATLERDEVAYEEAVSRVVAQRRG